MSLKIKIQSVQSVMIDVALVKHVQISSTCLLMYNMISPTTTWKVYNVYCCMHAVNMWQGLKSDTLSWTPPVLDIRSCAVGYSVCP